MLQHKYKSIFVVLIRWDCLRKLIHNITLFPVDLCMVIMRNPHPLLCSGIAMSFNALFRWITTQNCQSVSNFEEILYFAQLEVIRK